MSPGAEAGMTITSCLREISERLANASAIAKSALTCAETGLEPQAVTIAMDLDEILHEAGTLHRAMVLMSRINRERGRPAPT